MLIVLSPRRRLVDSCLVMMARGKLETKVFAYTCTFRNKFNQVEVASVSQAQKVGSCVARVTPHVNCSARVLCSAVNECGSCRMNWRLEAQAQAAFGPQKLCRSASPFPSATEMMVWGMDSMARIVSRVVFDLRKAQWRYLFRRGFPRLPQLRHEV